MLCKLTRKHEKSIIDRLGTDRGNSLALFERTEVVSGSSAATELDLMRSELDGAKQSNKQLQEQVDEFKKQVQELTEKEEKSMRHLRAARVPLERYAQEKESAGSPAEGEEMSLERILVLYEVERHLPPPVLGRYHRGRGCTPELFRVWTRGVLDKDEENMKIVRFLRKVIPEILREMGVRSEREEGSMVPISTPRATGEGEEKEPQKEGARAEQTRRGSD